MQIRLLIFWSLLGLLVLISSCTSDTTMPSTAPSSSQDKTQEKGTLSTVEKGDRASWQKPNVVIQKMGHIADKTIADIGAGTGYFSFRLVRDAKKVIAIDIDSSMLQLIDAFRNTMSSDLQSKLETRLALPEDPLLQKGEADIYLIVNTVAYLDRLQYFKTLRSIMKPGDQLFIVDFKVRRLPIEAPAYEDRVLMHIVEEDLYAAGFEGVTVDDRSLEHQYIIKAY